jgi:hypothetical protein
MSRHRPPSPSHCRPGQAHIRERDIFTNEPRHSLRIALGVTVATAPNRLHEQPARRVVATRHSPADVDRGHKVQGQREAKSETVHPRWQHLGWGRAHDGVGAVELHAKR